MSVFMGKIAFFGENVCFHGENSVFGLKCRFSRGKSHFSEKMSVFTGKIAFLGQNVWFHGENRVFGCPKSRKIALSPIKTKITRVVGCRELVESCRGHFEHFGGPSKCSKLP